MTHKKSKSFQSAPAEYYRIDEFEVYPQDRLLTRRGQLVPLTPKVFDALLLLLMRAEHLVTRRELMDTLWPSLHVTDANLTNTIGVLRKILGRNAIQTVSRHGYRLVLPVESQPGTGPELFQRFARARELTAHRSPDSLAVAREMFWLCLAEDPGFAPAWAWLGRCCWIRSKFSRDAAGDADLAEAAFRRAFTIDSDLACAHHFYTPVEVDTGHARRALVRLQNRLARYPDEPETLAGLVHVLRSCGRIDESLQAGRRAGQLDPTLPTSVPHTLFLKTEYAQAIEA